MDSVVVFPNQQPSDDDVMLAINILRRTEPAKLPPEVQAALQQEFIRIFSQTL